MASGRFCCNKPSLADENLARWYPHLDGTVCCDDVFFLSIASNRNINSASTYFTDTTTTTTTTTTAAATTAAATAAAVTVTIVAVRRASVNCHECSAFDAVRRERAI